MAGATKSGLRMGPPCGALDRKTRECALSSSGGWLSTLSPLAAALRVLHAHEIAEPSG
jgi:hypothetical protein